MRALSDRSNLQFIRLKILNYVNVTDMNEIIIGKAYLSLAPVGGRVRCRLARARHNLQKEILRTIVHKYGCGHLGTAALQLLHIVVGNLVLTEYL